MFQEQTGAGQGSCGVVGTVTHTHGHSLSRAACWAFSAGGAGAEIGLDLRSGPDSLLLSLIHSFSCLTVLSILADPPPSVCQALCSPNSEWAKQSFAEPWKEDIGA